MKWINVQNTNKTIQLNLSTILNNKRKNLIDNEIIEKNKNRKILKYDILFLVASKRNINEIQK